MLSREIDQYLKQILPKKVHGNISSLQIIPVGGGSINNTGKITINGKYHFFIKLNSAKQFPLLFEKESNGLHFLAAQDIIRIPQVIDQAIVGSNQVLILEWITPGIKSPAFWKTFGEQIAKLHRVNNEYHGFNESNYMGALPQINTPAIHWIDFFIQYRLQPQIKSAVDNHLLAKEQVTGFEKIYARLADIFDEEKSSLLHGDLWSGNYICNEKSLPVLIDPALYFGHRSMDLAMTTLFGGFDTPFYESYNYHFPLPANYREQWDICNLYPLLIHLNLFGVGYLQDIQLILKKFSV